MEWNHFVVDATVEAKDKTAFEKEPEASIEVQRESQPQPHISVHLFLNIASGHLSNAKFAFDIGMDEIILDRCTNVHYILEGHSALPIVKPETHRPVRPHRTGLCYFAMRRLCEKMCLHQF